MQLQCIYNARKTKEVEVVFELRVAHRAFSQETDLFLNLRCSFFLPKPNQMSLTFSEIHCLAKKNSALSQDVFNFSCIDDGRVEPLQKDNLF